MVDNYVNSHPESLDRVREITGKTFPFYEANVCDEAALDRYEGYPSFYYKTEMTLPIKGIRSGKVRNRKCFVYIMHEDRPLGIPSGYYVATCLEGYDSFEFDERYLYDAIENSRRDCNEG